MSMRPCEGMKRKDKATVPPEVALALRFGKQAYQRHSSWDSEPDDVCLQTYLICGRLIHDKKAGPQLWERFRGELLKKPGIQNWWGYQQFEKKRSKRV